ncbi:MAG: radical SAM protein [Mariprofundaceae bacterium]|nr:radical SAM protein [Mariprofundaceae bacterium]
MLGRLTINTTQFCNLGCLYCYAEGGSYGGKPIHLSSKTAIEMLTGIAMRYREINLVQFIGGEPLLNLPAMRDCCAALENLVDQGILRRMPNIAAVTNLTLVTDRHVALFDKYHVNLTVSIDGPEKIHDLLRPNKKKQGRTHTKIIRNLLRIKNANFSYAFEVTYTRLHFEHHITIIDLLRHFSPWKPAGIAIVVAALPDGHPLGFADHDKIRTVLDWQVDAIGYCLNQLAIGRIVPYGLFLDMIHVVMSEKEFTGDFCPAETSNLAISADGKIYGCHMFTNQEEHELAFNNNSFPSLHGEDDTERATPDFLSETPAVIAHGKHRKLPSKTDFPECVDCWARQWCRICVGNMAIRSPGSPAPSWDSCELNRRSLQLILQRLPRSLKELSDGVPVS